MDYDLIISGVLLVSLILGSLLFASLLFFVYEKVRAYKNEVSSMKELKIHDSSLEKLFFLKKSNFYMNSILILYVLLIIILVFISLEIVGLIQGGLTFDFLVIILISMIPILFFNFLNNDDFTLYKNSRGIFHKLFSSSIAFVLSLFSILIITGEKDGLLSIADFQNQTNLAFLNAKFPALFIFINPFAAISFFSGIVLISRLFMDESFLSLELNNKIATKLLRNMIFSALILAFIFIFIGGGQFSNFIIFNVFIIVLISFGVVLAISIVDFNRPKIIIERKVFDVINIPVLFSVLAVGLSVLIAII